VNWRETGRAVFNWKAIAGSFDLEAIQSSTSRSSGVNSMTVSYCLRRFVALRAFVVNSHCVDRNGGAIIDVEHGGNSRIET
jgi:hypothetical protein